MEKKKLSPRQATTYSKVCRLQTDHFDTASHWIMNDGYTVTIVEQRFGETSKRSISVPLKTFNKLVDWYFKPQKLTSNSQ